MDQVDHTSTTISNDLACAEYVAAFAAVICIRITNVGMAGSLANADRQYGVAKVSSFVR
ncbi:MAG: hypothetical protein ACKPER_01845 [Dolichospermum sp.]